MDRAHTKGREQADDVGIRETLSGIVPTVIKRAELSDCGTYRYRLTRHWDSDRPPMTFVMLNPSTADADIDDPTIRRCVGFAKREGAGGIVVVNLYAFRATDPRDLPKDGGKVGPRNEHYLHDAIMEANGRPIVCAWGTKGNGSFFVQWAKGYGANLMALGITKDGFPKHPLYIAGNAPLMPYPRRLGSGGQRADATPSNPPSMEGR